MALFDFLGRKSQPSASSPPRARAPIALARGPAYEPLPTTPGDSVDAQVVRLWIAHQRHSRDTSWHGFLTALVASNKDLAEQLRRAQAELADYRSRELFKP
jgi:hypothetical protein